MCTYEIRELKGHNQALGWEIAKRMKDITKG